MTPGTGMLGAVILALLLLMPSPVEARFHNRSLAVSKECNSQLPGHLAFRAAGPCKRQAPSHAESQEPAHKIFSGKFSPALAIELYCRTAPVGLSEVTRKNTANIPHPVPQRVIAVRAEDPDAWPRCDFGAGPDRGLVEAALRVRVPDG